MSSKWEASGQVPDRAVRSGLIPRFGAIDDTEGGNTSRTNANLELVKSFGNGDFLKNQVFYVRNQFQLFSNFTFFLNDPVNGDEIQQVEHRDIYGTNWRIILTGKPVTRVSAPKSDSMPAMTKPKARSCRTPKNETFFWDITRLVISTNSMQGYTRMKYGKFPIASVSMPDCV